MFLLDRRNFMKITAAGTATLAPGLAHAGIEVADVFTSAQDGLLVDSAVIMGEQSAVLVDAQFTTANATALAEMIAATGRKLESIIITHFHPDHLLGLPILLDRFPEAKAYAQSDVQMQISNILAPMHAQIVGSAPEGVYPATFVVPDKLAGDHLMLEGERIDVLPPMVGDTALITPVHVPVIDTLIASDVACIDTHLWIEEAAAPGGVDAWRDSIKTLQSIGAGTIIPGHRKPNSMSDASVFDATLAYLDHWEDALGASSNAQEMKTNLLAGKEDLGFAYAVDTSAAAAFPSEG